MTLFSGLVKAESFIRVRGYQPSPLLSESTEKGSYQVSSEKTKMGISFKKSQGWMISYKNIGIGNTVLNNTFSYDDALYQLESNSQDAALIFNGPGNTSFTLGSGIITSGKGSIVRYDKEFTSNKVEGRAVFGFFGLEYELPFNLGFIGLEFTEILFGYRENDLGFSNFESGSESLENTLKIKSYHYLFGIGLVF